MTRQALLHLDVSAPDIQRFTDAVRQELYAPLYDAHEDYPLIAQLQQAQRLLQLDWVRLPAESPLAGCTIGETRIRSLTGASIVAVLRDSRRKGYPAGNRCSA